MSKRVAFPGLVVLAFLAVPAALPAQQSSDFLKVVPDDALAFAVVPRIGEAGAKVQALAKMVNAPLPASPLELLKKKLGVDKGLDDKGSFVAVLLPGDGQPVPVVLMPVTDYKQFLAPLKPKNANGDITEVETADGETLLAGRKGNYAVFASPDAKSALKKVISSTKDAADGTAPLRDWLATNDAVMVLTSSGVKVVGAQLQQMLQLAKQATANLPAEAQFMADVVDSLDRLVKAAETDVTHIALGLQVDSAHNVKVATRVLFAKGSDFAKAGANASAIEGGPLAGLPGGPFVMAGGGAFSETTSKSLANFSAQIVKAAAADLPKEKQQKLEEAQALMAKGMRSMSFLWGVGKADEPLFASMASVMKVDNSTTFLANYEKGFKSMSSLAKEAKLPVGGLAIKKTEVAGVSALEVSVDLSQALPNQGNPMEKQMLEMMFGKDGKMTMTLAAVDANTILTRYAPASAAKEMVQAYKQRNPGLAADADVAKVASMLPAGAQWAVYVNPHGLMDLVGRIAGAVGGGAQLPAFPKTLPVGLGVKLSATGLDAQLVLPAAVLENIGALGRRLGQNGLQ